MFNSQLLRVGVTIPNLVNRTDPKTEGMCGRTFEHVRDESGNVF